MLSVAAWDRLRDAPMDRLRFCAAVTPLLTRGDWHTAAVVRAVLENAVVREYVYDARLAA